MTSSYSDLESLAAHLVIALGRDDCEGLVAMLLDKRLRCEQDVSWRSVIIAIQCNASGQTERGAAIVLGLLVVHQHGVIQYKVAPVP